MFHWQGAKRSEGTYGHYWLPRGAGLARDISIKETSNEACAVLVVLTELPWVKGMVWLCTGSEMSLTHTTGWYAGVKLYRWVKNSVTACMHNSSCLVAMQVVYHHDKAIHCWIPGIQRGWLPVREITCWETWSCASGTPSPNIIHSLLFLQLFFLYIFLSLL